MQITVNIPGNKQYSSYRGILSYQLINTRCNAMLPTALSTSEMMLCYLFLFSLWLSSILSFHTAFLSQSSYFFCLTCAMLTHSLALLLLLSVLHHCLQFGLESIWPGKGRHCTCAGEGHCPVHTAWGRGAASRVCTRVNDTSQTLPLALIGCIELAAVDSCKSNYSHWVET